MLTISRPDVARDAHTIVCVWNNEFYASACGSRLGFILKDIA